MIFGFSTNKNLFNFFFLVVYERVKGFETTNLHSIFTFFILFF